MEPGLAWLRRRREKEQSLGGPAAEGPQDLSICRDRLGRASFRLVQDVHSRDKDFVTRLRSPDEIILQRMETRACQLGRRNAISTVQPLDKIFVNKTAGRSGVGP